MTWAKLQTSSSGDQHWISTSQNWVSQLLEQPQAYVKKYSSPAGERTVSQACSYEVKS